MKTIIGYFLNPDVGRLSRKWVEESIHAMYCAIAVDDLRGDNEIHMSIRRRHEPDYWDSYYLQFTGDGATLLANEPNPSERECRELAEKVLCVLRIGVDDPKSKIVWEYNPLLKYQKE